MNKRILSRRDFVRLTAVGTAGMLAACVAPAPQAPGAPVEGTAAPEAAEKAAEEAVSTMGFPRSETLFADMATGRVGAPTNFNEWVGWKKRDRGMAQLMNEPLWTDESAAGEIINGLAAGPPTYSADFTQVTIQAPAGRLLERWHGVHRRRRGVHHR